jgi:hypothetical protein
MPRDLQPQRPRTAPDDSGGDCVPGQARAGRLRDLAAVLSVLVLSAAVAILALGTARGVVPSADDRYATEFVSKWWWLAFLLVPVPAAYARRRPTTAAAATAALVVPHFVAAAVSRVPQLVGRHGRRIWALRCGDGHRPVFGACDYTSRRWSARRLCRSGRI